MSSFVRNVGVLALLVLSGLASSSHAADRPEIVSFSADVSVLRAGAHPDSNVTFEFARAANPISGWYDIVGGSPKTIKVDLPPGLVGNPTNVARCTVPQLTQVSCPVTSQVGTVRVMFGKLGDPFEIPTDPQAFTPIYNLAPIRGEVARFGLRPLGSANSFISLKLRPSDHGLTATVPNIWDGQEVWGSVLTIWGVPADPSHDSLRQCYRNPTLLGCGAATTPVPFMTNGANCAATDNATLSVETWQNPGSWATARSIPQQLTDCDNLVFRPRIDVFADNSERGQPLGIGVDITIPQTYDNPSGLATPPLRNARVTLPEGVAISSSSWYGLEACSDAQLGAGNDAPATCPNASKLGDVTVTTPLLSETLTGGIFLGTQLSDDPQSGDLFRIALQIGNADRGLNIKLLGKIFVDPNTGRITASFVDNPQLPFDRLSLRFKGGARAPLTTPTTCGPATSTAELQGWGMAEPARSTSTFQVTHDGSGAPCPLGFSPSFVAGTVNPVGGVFTPFTLSFGRDDDDQDLRRISVNFPAGLLARISDIPVLCTDGAANAGTCSEGSRVGSVTVATGPGPNPPSVPGRVYLTEAYGGGAFGLSIVVPAVVGPFNLGTVVVRAAIIVDRNTAKLTVISDPMPLILKGVPLRARDVSIDVDRPNFMFNPTNCNPMRVDATIGSADGAVANVGSRFQVGNCASLPFTPKMTLKVGARGKLTRGKRTPLDVTLSMTRGQANNRSVQVTLPKTINARLDVVNRRVACTIQQFRADRCPMVVGTGTAVTPLLRDPLRGPAYFVYNPARRLPDLAIRLKGQVEFDLIGKVAITRDLRLQTTFDTVPDVPITKFRLQLASGSRNGPVGLTRSVCSPTVRRTLAASLAFTAQSNKKVSRSQKISVAGCGRAAARRAASRSRTTGRRTRR